MTFKEWENKVPKEITNDIVWKIEAYRFGLFLSDACWKDSSSIIAEKRFALADQLYRSVGSISANIVEGYSRLSNKEKARFCEIALGSAREARDWYFKSRHIIGEETAQTRIIMLTSIARLLQSMISNHRKYGS
ncbi:MAG: four helix bundle protein [Balneola sp.]|jgi:four helix bundle protein|nr:four helix bundle protein [Balneola sp.]MBE79371.1 four helix bundle protein [Balneola sp.]HBX65455.1 four helix bundle protein [Balneolaceae bacterium]|tara:strand:+ start:856 stop:1257 length:402 start_codon:yes stop_codon:yes gene_type:complete